MQKFILTIYGGDECSGSWEEFIPFEAKSKEDLAFELNIALLEFEIKKDKVLAEAQSLRDKWDKLNQGSHKKAPDYESAREVYTQMRAKEDSVKYFEFQGRKFDWTLFFYRADSSDFKSHWILDEIKESRIKTLDEWYESQKKNIE